LRHNELTAISPNGERVRCPMRRSALAGESQAKPQGNPGADLDRTPMRTLILTNSSTLLIFSIPFRKLRRSPSSPR